jgi:hypothetical protein
VALVALALITKAVADGYAQAAMPLVITFDVPHRFSTAPTGFPTPQPYDDDEQVTAIRGHGPFLPTANPSATPTAAPTPAPTVATIAAHLG